MVDAVTKWARQYAAIVLLLIAIAFLAIITHGDTDKMQITVNDAFGVVVKDLSVVLFWAIPGLKMPLVVVVLIGGALFFTFRFAFINLRGFKHATEILRGIYDDPEAPGEVSHFQALSSALSATIGLGNIAGVAIAVSVGGPGAVFWMMFAALFGMTSKFTECTLAQMYRQVDDKGVVRGGAMIYLREGLAELGWPKVGKVLSVLFAVLCIGGSFGGGNMFQANQSFVAMTSLIPALGGEKATATVRVTAKQPVSLDYERHLVKFTRPADKATDVRELDFRPVKDVKVKAGDWAKDADGSYHVDIDAEADASGIKYNLPKGAVSTVAFGTVAGRKVNWKNPEKLGATSIEKFRGGTGHMGWLYGLLLAVLVGIVIVGGIKRIGNVADKVVPFMCILYVLSSLAVLFIHFDKILPAIGTIVHAAFSGDAMYGGFIGVLVQGVRRAAFSNEAGVGSAAIAHSAAKTKFPVREGLVASLGPFIDTIIICFMTGIVIVITGVYADPATAGLDGVLLTGAAFSEALSSVAQYLLAVAVVLFAFSTMISWSYYGERCWSFLFGSEQTFPYRVLFCAFVWLGCVASLGNVLDFSDLMILSMAFPNIVGLVIMSNKIKRQLDAYWSSYKNGEFKRFA